MAKVIVKVNPSTQEVTYEVEGVMGTKCTDITKALVATNDEVDTQYTAEYCVPEELPDYIENMEGDE
tara:strand:+ start:1066 stop:1266 length:201 start_codon:yes stop_codon:yes gene_type:complete